MVAKCPQCGRLPIQARNELTLLKLAEAGQLTTLRLSKIWIRKGEATDVPLRT
jgi:hypothetical protein